MKTKGGQLYPISEYSMTNHASGYSKDGQEVCKLVCVCVCVYGYSNSFITGQRSGLLLADISDNSITLKV